MAMLAWIVSKKVFLKVQEGTGDNLEREDLDNGFVDYVLWSTFQPDCLDADEELEMCALDGGMVMFKKELTRDEFVTEGFQGAYEQAFDHPFTSEDSIILSYGSGCLHSPTRKKTNRESKGAHNEN